MLSLTWWTGAIRPQLPKAPPPFTPAWRYPVSSLRQEEWLAFLSNKAIIHGRKGRGDFWWKIHLVWRFVLKGGMEKLCLGWNESANGLGRRRKRC